MKKKIFLWLKILVIAYCLVGIALYYLQDKIFFHPEPLKASYQYKFSLPHKEVNIPYTHESNMNIVQFLPADSAAKGVVLYFHGNMDNISHYAPRAPLFIRNVYEVWMIDYPGYGKSTGEFTEENLYDWALTFYKLARAHYAEDSIIIYGRSLGTGIAAQLATKRGAKALILEAPYYSFPSAAANWLGMYPVEKMIHFKLPTWQYIQDVIAPVIIFHGTGDGVISYRNARRLQPYLKPVDRFITIEDGSHNDLDQFDTYTHAMDSILQK